MTCKDDMGLFLSIAHDGNCPPKIVGIFMNSVLRVHQLFQVLKISMCELCSHITANDLLNVTIDSCTCIVVISFLQLQLCAYCHLTQ